MKAYIVQMGEDYSVQSLVKGFLDKQKAIDFAQELADKHHCAQQDETYWWNGLDSIEVVEVEIEDLIQKITDILTAQL